MKYATGKGVQKDDAQAVAWYQKAADQGNAEAQCNLGEMYENAQGGLAKDDTEAVRWFRKAAEQGNAEAQNHLGDMYHGGLGGLGKDESEALRWVRKAAEQGNAIAQTNLGVAYEHGLGGLVKNDIQAVSWYQKAAEQGYWGGQNNLAGMYYDGRGVAKDDTEAVRWWRESAEQGNAEPQYNLGVMYEHGQGGLQKDVDQAISWYQKAAAQGYEGAKAPLDRLLAKQREEQERKQEAEERINGTPLSFDDFYVKLHTAFSAGQRYNVFTRISISTGFCFSNPSSDNELDHLFCAEADAAFDDASQYEALLKGPRWQKKTVVFSEGYDGRLLIYAAK